MPLLNTFLVGADPEFALVQDGHLQLFRGRAEMYAPWGTDHGGYAIEPHPKPELSVRNLVTNIKASLNDFAMVAPEGKWRAGAYVQAPERTLTMGGHVHIDQPRCSQEQRNALDLFTQHLEALDILPKTECQNRRGAGHYGQYGDIRTEHGHFEYRTLPSWLFSQRVAKICLTGTKLLAVDPTAAVETLGTQTVQASKEKLRNLFERFKNKDDDADWILDSGMLAKNLNVKPDRDLRNVWKVQPEKEEPHWKEEEAKRKTLAGKQDTIGWPLGDTYIYRLQHDNVQYRVRLNWRQPWNDGTRGIIRDYIIAHDGLPADVRGQWVVSQGLVFMPCVDL